MSLIYLIEGGKPLQLVQQHITERQRVQAQNRVIAEELGVRKAVTDRFAGVLVGVVFPGGKAPQGWTRPDRKGVSYPKKGSPMAVRFDEQVGYRNPVAVISDDLGVPCYVEYKDASGGFGACAIGDNPFQPCGWLCCSALGPFALFTPDVMGEVQAMADEGKRVTGTAATYTGAIEGCRKIDKEEWDFIVARHALEVKRAEYATEVQKGGAA